MDDAEPGGGAPGPEDEEEYAEFPDGPPQEPKQELQAEAKPVDAQSSDVMKPKSAPPSPSSKTG